MARTPITLDDDGNGVLGNQPNFFQASQTAGDPGRFVVANRSDSAVTVVVTAPNTEVDLIDPVSAINSKAGRLTRNPSEADVAISTDLTVATLRLGAGAWYELNYTNGTTAHSMTATAATRHRTAAADEEVVLIYDDRS